MKKQLLIGLLVAVSLVTLPSVSLAARVQNVDGGSIVSMDYPSGKDMIVVDNFSQEFPIRWDIYLSDNPTEKNSWDLTRRYKAPNVSAIHSDYYYNMLNGPAVAYKDAWYFVVIEQELVGITLVPRETHIWRVKKRGGKPQLVGQFDQEGYFYSDHMPLITLDGKLVFVNPIGEVYRSTNGQDWTLTNTIEEVTEHFHGNDMVSNGKKVFLSIDGKVYRSGNAREWTLLGDLCADENSNSCSVKNIQVRPKKGVFAVVNLYHEESIGTHKLWTYKKHRWQHTETFARDVIGLETFGKATYTMQYEDVNGYTHSIKKILPSGRVVNVRGVRTGTPMAMLAHHFAAINLRDADFLTLIRY